MIGASVPADSLLDVLDARLRLLAALSFALVVVSSRGFLAPALANAAALVLVVVARLPLDRTLHRLLHVDGFILLALATLPFSTPGDIAFSLGPLAASRQGLAQAGLIALQANAAILALFALVASLETVSLGRALAGLQVSPKLVQLLLMTVRYISVIEREYRSLRLAMKARAFRARSDRHTWRSFGYLFGMLLVRSFDRAERILIAMKCRGFDGRFPVAEHARFNRRDLWCGLGWLAVLGLLIGIDRI
ncbi:MAG: cobalt ECF transporter T component CbiQ [Azospirillum sp.]|nr:cobalt ECF transporter T component CbiQ [Azospirillum sp.]